MSFNDDSKPVNYTIMAARPGEELKLMTRVTTGRLVPIQQLAIKACYRRRLQGKITTACVRDVDSTIQQTLNEKTNAFALIT